MSDGPEPCPVCNDTGRWPGYPKPCPECGAYLIREKTRTERWTPTPVYREAHPRPNRKMRRQEAKRRRKE